MRDNISIIFAAIFAVLLLIVFPLFSLLTRQDSISYNKVLTLTTEFVDSVRTKGYFTEQEYTDYLTGLSNTRNTYKVELECHKKILIKDVNKYTKENPVWVEDTAIYYNSFVENELKNSKVVSLEEGDEFYIKVYNTNITTASLMYNFFLNSRIPRKVINIGYGGKILKTSGNTFAKTVFNSSYTPYITFSEVTDSTGKEFKRCYDQEAGTYQMQYCVRNINVEEDINNPIKVNFKMHNFAKIGDIFIDSRAFSENIEYIREEIKKKVNLRGNYIYSYEVSVDDLKFVNDNIEGTIKISNIRIGSGAWKTTAYIVIESNLGTGTTGAASSEGTTEELTFKRRDLASNMEITGPYLSKETTEVLTTALKSKEKVYFKITLRDSEEIKKLILTENGKNIVDDINIRDSKEYNTENFDIKIDKATNGSSLQEYWVEITPTVEFENTSIIGKKEYELQLIAYADTYVDLNETLEVKSVSSVVVWRLVESDIKCISIKASPENSAKEVVVNNLFTIRFNAGSYRKINNYGVLKFFNDLKDLGLLYISVEGKDSLVDYDIKNVEVTSGNNPSYKVTVSCKLAGRPEKATVNVNFANTDDTIKTAKFRSHINVPEHCWYVEKNDKSGFGFRRNDAYKYEEVFLWEDASVEYIDMQGNEYPSYYDSDVTKEKITESIRKYGGFYFSSVVKSVSVSKSSTESNFSKVWSDSKRTEVGFSGFSGNMFFSSVMYDWQLRLVLRNSRMMVTRTSSSYVVLANIQGENVETAMKVNYSSTSDKYNSNGEMIKINENESYYKPTIKLQTVINSARKNFAEYTKVLYIK